MPIPKVVVGDRIHLYVPVLRCLPRGEYEMEVDSVTQTPKRINMSLSFKDKGRICSLKFEVMPEGKIGWGWGFLGDDNHPCQFQLEQNLASRLASSLETNRRQKR